MLMLALLSLCSSAEAQRRTRIARPLKKIHTDTIVIPDDMIFHSEETLSQPSLTPEPASPSPEPKKQKAKTAVSLGINTPIMGEPEIDAEQMYRFVAARNPEFPREIAEAFYEIGRRYGVRGDIAL